MRAAFKYMRKDQKGRASVLRGQWVESKGYCFHLDIKLSNQGSPKMNRR